MRERGRPVVGLLLVIVNIFLPLASCQSRGDEGALGFDDVVRRHDGYVKGETPTIPQTSFRCDAQPYNPGLYADVETQCQVYHVCFEDRQESFLCGPGTNFNQRLLTCDFWYNFNCQDTPSFYSVNSEIGKVPDAVGGGPGQVRVPQPQQPSYPNYPRQQEQPPSGGSFQPRVTVPPPPPPRIEPQHPQIQPQPPRIQPQPPRIQPQPPRIQPQPPRIQPQPPRVQPPSFRPQPRPDINQVEIKPHYPPITSVGDGRVSSHKPSIQQEDDSGYQFDGYKPPKPDFPPVVSPPRVSRPPLNPPVVIRQPEPSISRPRIPESHPDANLKGGYVPPPPPRIPQPSRPVGTEYPNYPVPQRPVAQRPIQQKPVAQKPVSKRPPPDLQQEHIDVDYIPPPPPPPQQPIRPPPPQPRPPPPPQQPIRRPPPPQQPIRPPPVPQQPIRPPPVHQRPVEPDYVAPPPQRKVVRPPPPPAQVPIEPDYDRPQPPVAPSIIREQQKPIVPPPNRPHISEGSRQPQRPVFPPVSDHPNSNIKGGPGYNQPPPQVTRFEPTRIARPSSPQEGYVAPQPVPQRRVAVKQNVERRPSPSVSTGHKVPQQERIKRPSEHQNDIYQPPISAVDHPRSEIKGSVYVPAAQNQQRVKAPSTNVGRVKQPQRPRAPIVVSRPATSIKRPEPVDTNAYEKRQPSRRIKQPSQQQIQRVTRPSYQPVDHPNANIKGGSGYRPQPSTSYEQKLPEYDVQQEIKTQDRPSGIKTASQIVHSKQPKPDYDSWGSSYTSGPDSYPKPEFGQPSAPYQPVSTPSRSSSTIKQRAPSQNTITHSRVKPAYQESPDTSGFGTAVRPDYPSRGVAGHQPPNQPQVFPHRENPDHPNESLKGSGAYRPPPPAGFQAAASEVQQVVEPASESQQQIEQEPSSLHGDIGAE